MTYQNHTALLIDAENTPLEKLTAYLEKAQPFGRDITLKRAYGNWGSPCLKNWESTLRTHAIRAVQLFDCAVGKNAADIALTADAMELLHTGQYDIFIIMSSDSDYTPLVMKLRDAGVRVLGIGKADAPEAYRNACTGYLPLHNIYAPDPDSLQAPQEQFSHFDEDDLFDENAPEDEEITAKARAILCEIGLSDDEDVSGKTIIWDTLDDDFPDISHASDTTEMRGVHKLMQIAYDYCKGENGFAPLASVGNFIRDIRPELNYHDYGFTQLHSLLQAYPDRYEVIEYPSKTNARVMAFRCRT